jgi:Spy/CpxP family protein refolding chaperone
MTCLILALLMGGSGPVDATPCLQSRPPQSPRQQERPRSEPQGRSPRGPFKWWLDPAISAELGLTKDQVEKIQGIYDGNVSSSRPLLSLLTRYDQEYQKLLQQEQPDEATVLEAIDRIEHVRYQIGKARSVMLYRFYKCLTKRQQAAFTKRLGSGRSGRGPRTH